MPAGLLDHVDASDADSLRIPMSLEEYLALPDGRFGPYWKVEWVNGVAILNAPNIRHQATLTKLIVLLSRALPEALILPDSNVRMSGSRRRPDITVLPGFPADPVWIDEGALILVEIASPSTWREDLGPKVEEYLTLGAQQYWTVDPETNSVTIRRNTGVDWEVTDVLDSENPSTDIPVEMPDGSSASVQLSLAAVFA